MKMRNVSFGADAETGFRARLTVRLLHRPFWECGLAYPEFCGEKKTPSKFTVLGPDRSVDKPPYFSIRN